MLSPEYVAGLFDGEGFVSIIYCKRRKWKSDETKHIVSFRIIVGIANTFQPVLIQVQRQFGGDIHLNTKGRTSFHKDVLCWKLTGAQGQINFLNTIAPYAIIKNEQISTGLSFLGTVGTPGQRIDQNRWDKRLQCAAKMKELNRRGLPKPDTHKHPPTPPMGWNPSYR